MDEIENSQDDNEFILPDASPEESYAAPPSFPVEDEALVVVPPPEPQGFNAFPDPEPEKQDALMIFNKAWNVKLDAKRAQEAEHEKSVKAQATEELANWKQQRDIRLKAKKEKNRSEEQVLLEALESESDGSNAWEKVTKLIDANAGDSAETGKADTTRMRKLFIQLKGEPLEKTRAQALKA